MSTNRDIYLAIGAFRNDPALPADRTLEDYLRALLVLCQAHRDAAAVTVEDFLDLLRRAFVETPADFDVRWGNSGNAADDAAGFAAFESVLLAQIVDLHEMREAGILDGKLIYFGVRSPRGRQWFNFDPRGYLECAATGSLGGWEPGDPGGRDFVPGPVATLDPEGKIVSADPRDLERPIQSISQVSWQQFADFLYCGQIYE